MPNIGNWFTIDRVPWNVTVVSISETANILYSENTGRTMSEGARMTLDPLGTFIGHKVVVKRKGDDFNSFDKLFEYLCLPRFDGMHVKIVDGQSTIEYDAYISTVTREVERIDDRGGKVFWKEMELNIVPMEAQIKP